MRANLCQHRAIRDVLTQEDQGELTGRFARHLSTLAAYISGIVASSHARRGATASTSAPRTQAERGALVLDAHRRTA